VRLHRKSLILVLTLFLAGIPARAQQLAVAAAADLKFAITDVVEQFETKTGTKVNVTYGSSGNLFAQLKNGAPFDVFLSADMGYARKLDEAELVEPGTLSRYATGRIAIWAPADSKLNVSESGWKTLLDERVKKIAIANPEHAPYGRAAVAAMQKAGIYDQVKSKLVFGENISQAAQFVQSGNAQAGILALSLAVSDAMKDGKRWDIPEDLHPPVEQAAIVMKNAKNKEAAGVFLEFVKSDAGRATLAKYGFALPAK
jgi:molybdate transport system substrate-binding protein